MMRVLALGMSSPDSMMEVHTSTSISPWANRDITSSNSFSCILPWPMAMLAWGTSCWMWSATRWMDWIRLCRKKVCPPRSNSLWIASCMTSSLYSHTVVLMGSRSSGGVSMVLMSRMPDSDR